MRNLLLFLLFLCFCLQSYDCKSIGSVDKLSFHSQFNNDFEGISFVGNYVKDFNNDTLIIPIINNNIEYSINNIKDLALAKENLSAGNIKNKLIELSKSHSKLYLSSVLTVQNIYIPKAKQYYCIIHDKNNLIKAKGELKKGKYLQLFYLYHELEHCYINSFRNPVFHKGEFYSFLPEGNAKEADRLYSLYIMYLQEMFADISAYNKLSKDYPEIDWFKLISRYREKSSKEGDFFHNSSAFLDRFNEYAYNKDITIRNEVLTFLHLNSLDIMPINDFILKVNNQDNHLPIL